VHGVTAQAKTFIFCVKQWFNDGSTIAQLPFNYRLTTVPKEARRYSTYDNVDIFIVRLEITLKQAFVLNSPLEGWQPKVDGVDRFL
jgi:hypothetical protein